MISDEFEKTREDALKHLRNRDRSSAEIRDHLRRKKHDDEAIEEALLYLADCGLVNDRRYCENYIDESIRRRKGRRLIKAELMRKGLDRILVDEQIGRQLTRDTERENAEYEAGKLLAGGIDSGSLGKAMRRLAYLGYESDLIYELLETFRKSEQ